MAELSRDLGAARAAYAAGNVDAMRRAHSDDKTLQNTTSNAPYREAGHGSQVRARPSLAVAACHSAQSLVLWRHKQLSSFDT